MDITQEEYRVAKQNGRIIHTKIIILNFDFQMVDEISGVVLEGSTYSIDATSDIRRTCNISLIPIDNSFDIKFGSKLWMDKYVQVFIGIEDLHNNNEVVYSNIGLYLINNPSQVYDAINNTITISGIDLMAKMTGMRNGYLEGITYQVLMNTGIKQAMTALIRDECGFKYFSIDQPNPTILTPYDMSWGLGSTAYNILSQLRDINAGYQTYFDQDGIFWFNQIPSGANEQVRVDDDIWEKVLISYKKNTDFESVKNIIEVFGKTQDDGRTPYGKAMETNPESPFYIGEELAPNRYKNGIRIVLSGGEYDNIFPISGNFNSLAQQRANYELYLRCRLQDQVELTCVPVYWLDVNWLVNITLPNKQSPNTHKEQYVIKKINTTLGVNGTQNITMMKYYPLYPST